LKSSKKEEFEEEVGSEDDVPLIYESQSESN